VPQVAMVSKKRDLDEQQTTSAQLVGAGWSNRLPISSLTPAVVRSEWLGDVLILTCIECAQP
jgi:hypothetical protein